MILLFFVGVSFFFVERFGRRRLLLIGGVVMLICLLIVGGMGTISNVTPVTGGVIIAFR